MGAQHRVPASSPATPASSIVEQVERRRRHAARGRGAGRLGPARLLGVIHLKDVVKDGMRERFDEMRAMGIRTVMITGDNADHR